MADAADQCDDMEMHVDPAVLEALKTLSCNIFLKHLKTRMEKKELHEAAQKLPKAPAVRDKLDMQVVLNAIVHQAVHPCTVQRIQEEAAEAATQTLLTTADPERAEAATARFFDKEESKKRKLQHQLS